MPEFEGLASALGRSVPARRGGEATDRLRPTLPQNAPPRSLSATYGLAAFPFHTDGAHHRVPPRFVLMRLADGAASGTPTLLVDGYRSLIDAVDRKMLARETWLVHGGFGRTFYAPILDTARGLLRFDPGCMRHPAGTAPKGGGHLNAAARTGAAYSDRLDARRHVGRRQLANAPRSRSCSPIRYGPLPDPHSRGMTQPPDIWLEDALLRKARVYVERASSVEAGTGLEALWSLVALEFLARAALARIHPALLADPQDGVHLRRSGRFGGEVHGGRSMTTPVQHR